MVGGARSPYVGGIDGLRAVAVLAVIAFHLNPVLAPGGFRGVDVFFAISGFVVTGSLVGRPAQSWIALALGFYRRRAFRILPALVVCLLVTAVVASLLIPPSWLGSQARNTMLGGFFGLSNLVLLREIGGYFEPVADYNPFLHTWSLGVEEQFYLLFPVLLTPLILGRRRTGVALFAGVTALSLIAWFGLHQINDKWAFYSFPSRFWEIGAGVLLRLTMDRWSPWLGGLSPRAAAGVATLAWATLAGCLWTGPVTGGPIEVATVAVTLFLTAMAAARPQDLAMRAAATSMVAGIGRLSYSLYLWHWPTFVVFRWTVGLDRPSHAVAALAITFALAFLSYRFVETPARRSRLAREGPDLRVLAGSLALALASAALAFGLYYWQPHLSLSVTRDAAVWYADDRVPVSFPDPLCRVVQTREHIDGGIVTTIVGAGCPGRADARVILAVGDSHALNYLPMLRAHTAATGEETRIAMREFCGFLVLYDFEPSDTECARFHQGVLAAFALTARPGDVLMPSLRLERLSDFTGPVSPDLEDPLTTPQSRAAAIPRAEASLAPLSARGVDLVFEAPKPLFRSPPFRCSDSFNRNNPACVQGSTISRTEMLALRAPIMESMAMLRNGDARVSVWDPFDVLCPGDPCSAWLDGKPLYLDGDHLTAHGALILRPSFEEHLRTLRPRQHAAPTVE